MWDIDVDDIDVGDEQETAADDDGIADWGDEDPVVENWEDAEDPDEVEKRKKEEAERIQKEKEAVIEAEKQRKLEKKLERERRKQQQKMIEEGDDVDGLFDVDIETINENTQRMDFQNALDAFGTITDTTDSSNINIATFVPKTVGEFDSYGKNVLDMINKFFPEEKDKKKKQTQIDNKIKLIQFLITYLTDDYKGNQINDLYKYIINLYNKQLIEKKKGMGIKVKKAPTNTNANANAGQKTFMKTSKNNDFDEGFDDDFM
ncbi:hypothetical protein GPJ56_005424 [Histomonas meleagridis]|uniref:uncharacterized protein n=1 Tax=Histomonas meleagridis TaxID=135588 RepID=UPI00355A22D8|nr:hypothetical protein GPJ56_005424 [Histomonas meleagridis]KAH0801805.1 hypothetical protein GO595_005372 [Histomonas meleagridis]